MWHSLFLFLSVFNSPDSPPDNRLTCFYGTQISVADANISSPNREHTAIALPCGILCRTKPTPAKRNHQTAIPPP